MGAFSAGNGSNKFLMNISGLFSAAAFNVDFAASG
jgi:hypothetical protein